MQPKFRRLKEKWKIFSNAWEFKKIKTKVGLNMQNAMIKKKTNPDTSKTMSDISYFYIYINIDMGGYGYRYRWYRYRQYRYKNIGVNRYR